MFLDAVVFWLGCLVARYSAACCTGAITAITGMVGVTAPWPVLGMGCVTATRLGAPKNTSSASRDWGVPSPALNSCVIFRICIAKHPHGVVRGAVAVTAAVVGLANPPAAPTAKCTSGVVVGAEVVAAASPLATLVNRHVPPAVSVIPSNAPLYVILLSVLFFFCPFDFPDFYCYS